MADARTQRDSGTQKDFAGFRNLKANFTTVPNQYFDRIVGHYHPCIERVVAILIRSTLGWEDPDTGERRLEAELALRQFVRPELSESSARTGIAGAIEAGFIIQTMEATNRQPARYALRWEDAGAQREAITRQRKAHGSPKRRGVPTMQPGWKKRVGEKDKQSRDVEEKRGVSVGPPTATPLTVGPLAVAPPNSNESGKKSSPEKKRSLKKGFAPRFTDLVEEELDTLPAAEYAALEAAARARVIAEAGEPIRTLARQGNAKVDVKRMMLTLLRERESK